MTMSTTHKVQLGDYIEINGIGFAVRQTGTAVRQVTEPTAHFGEIPCVEIMATVELFAQRLTRREYTLLANQPTPKEEATGDRGEGDFVQK